MKEITKIRWKKFGYFWLSFVPMIGYLVVSFAVSMVIAVMVAVSGILGQQEDIYTYVVNGMMNSSMLAGVIYAVLAIVGFGLWYYFGCKRKQWKLPKGVLTPVNTIIIIVFAFCMQYVVTYLMTLLGVLMPQALESYVELIELAGVGEVTVAGILYGVILGPIAEELVFRGLTLYFAEKFTKRFWLANILQAALFGLFHMNLIQGIYAFALGLIMGWIYKSFHSLYASILFHVAFNGLSFGPLEVIDGILPKNIVFQIIWGILMCGLAVFLGFMLHKKAVGLMKNRKNAEKEAAGIGQERMEEVGQQWEE